MQPQSAFTVTAKDGLAILSWLQHAFEADMVLADLNMDIMDRRGFDIKN